MDSYAHKATAVHAQQWDGTLASALSCLEAVAGADLHDGYIQLWFDPTGVGTQLTINGSSGNGTLAVGSWLVTYDDGSQSALFLSDADFHRDWEQ